MIDIHSIKDEAVRRWFGRDGVVGVGIGGPNQINVYVLSDAAATKIPATLLGATVEVTVTGEIVAAGDAP